MFNVCLLNRAQVYEERSCVSLKPLLDTYLLFDGHRYHCVTSVHTSGSNIGAGQLCCHTGKLCYQFLKLLLPLFPGVNKRGIVMIITVNLLHRVFLKVKSMNICKALAIGHDIHRKHHSAVLCILLSVVVLVV